VRTSRPSIRRSASPLSQQRGIALIVALWLTVLLTVIASGFAFSMRTEAQAARNAISLAQARAAADGAAERMTFELLRPRNLPDVWNADGRVRQWMDGDIAIAAVAVDESARIDLNSASDALLKSLLQNVGGLSSDDAQAMLDKILDWRDPDDLRRPQGAEEADYRAAGLKYKPSNAPFDGVSELRLVLGMTPALYDRISPTLTVYSRQPGINAATASREVLLALPQSTPESVDAFLQQRRNALDAKLAIPMYPPAQAFTTGAAAVWRVHAEAVLPDGVTFARDAVVRLAVGPKRIPLTLLWQDGARTLLPQPAPDQPAAANSNGNQR
jgi:general secretion pathway protein K